MFLYFLSSDPVSSLLKEIPKPTNQPIYQTKTNKQWFYVSCTDVPFLFLLQHTEDSRSSTKPWVVSLWQHARRQTYTLPMNWSLSWRYKVRRDLTLSHAYQPYYHGTMTMWFYTRFHCRLAIHPCTLCLLWLPSSRHDVQRMMEVRCNVNKGHLSRCNVNKGHLSRCNVNKGHLSRCNVNKGHLSRFNVNKGHLSRFNVNKGHLFRCNVNKGHLSRCNANKDHLSRCNENKGHLSRCNARVTCLGVSWTGVTYLGVMQGSPI